MSKRRPIPKQKAIDIVRERIAKEFPNLVYDCNAAETHDGYTVQVNFDDEQAQLIGFAPGSQFTYRLSRGGKVNEVFGGP